MFPTEKIASGTLNALLFYCSVMGILLYIATLLRIKIKLFKNLFIPASLIAGTLGLILGQYGIGVLPPEMTQSWGAMPGRLITIVFAPMLIGLTIPNPKKVGNLIGPQLIFGYVGDFIQIGIPFIITALILKPLWNVNDMIGSIVEIGWCGGHGTAGGMIDVFKQLNWEDGGPLGLTSATVGLFIGIIVGMIIINYGVRKGYTSVLKSEDSINSSVSYDIIPQSEQQAAAVTTINKDVVESFAFHGSLISIAIFIGWILQKQIASALNIGMPLFPMAMIGGLIVQLAIAKTKIADAVDVRTLQRIQGLALEFLIIGAIASIKVPVVVAYAVPLLILMISTAIITVLYFFWAGPRIFKNEWFEHSIVNFGALTGVTAVGLMLLRTVDPEMKTEASRAFALRAPFFSPFAGGGLITSILPVLAVKYGALKTGIMFLGIAVVLLIAARVMGFWGKPNLEQSSVAHSRK
ncbi:sodium/glutamate symporter [Anaeromicrobium sediminis]|uniref:Sodium:glutamate symporter n=1 Tax=Anaeromicrobium sediminis TaxID=1478221 RepID=A0A267MJ64_9FIRM|nr:sodium:glutamate symporter [Anaeromicrobium sediminis]PAB59609.1 sodium:glutamate symporter [Anaeromicrobium sediminis]